VKTNSPGYTRVYRAVYGAIGGSLGTIAADPESAGGRSRSLVFRALVVSSSSPDDWEKPYSEEHAMKKCDISEKEKRVDGKNERPYTTAMMEKFYTIHIKDPTSYSSSSRQQRQTSCQHCYGSSHSPTSSTNPAHVRRDHH
jgi:hypothetical protein